jgi:hypothetical protein
VPARLPNEPIKLLAITLAVVTKTLGPGPAARTNMAAANPITEKKSKHSPPLYEHFLFKRPVWFSVGKSDDHAVGSTAPEILSNAMARSFCKSIISSNPILTRKSVRPSYRDGVDRL